MRRVLVVAIFLVAGSAVILGVVYGANKYLSTSEIKVNPAAKCAATLATHDVSIHGSVASPDRIEAKLCDRLVITNEDDRLRLIAFGTHNNHQAYDDVTEKVLSQGQSLAITLNQRGSYEFHDHLQDTLIGYFTVAN